MKYHVLFVCTANIQRSPTAECLFHGWNGRWQAKSAGILPEAEGSLLTQELLDWADLVIVMEAVHAYHINTYFKCAQNKLRILGIRDRYYRDDPELIKERQKRVTPMLEGYAP